MIDDAEGDFRVRFPVDGAAQECPGMRLANDCIGGLAIGEEIAGVVNLAGGAEGHAAIAAPGGVGRAVEEEILQCG